MRGTAAWSTLAFFLVLSCSIAKGVPISEQEECDPQKDGHLYAMNGSDSSEGRLEVCHERSIRNVCDLKLNFSMINADVACYQLGFAGAKDVVNNGTAFGRSTTDQAWLANLQCNGLEERLKDCNPAGWYKGNDCSVGTAVGVRCNRELQIRMLHNNKISYHGYVELHYFGSWNVLCDQGWKSGNGAEVVCHELGLGKVLEHSVIASETFMKDFLVTSTQCIGQEPFLKDCTKNTWNISDTCLNNTVAYLYCEGPCVNVTPVGATAQSVSLTIAWCTSSRNQKYYAAKVHYLVSYDIMSNENNSSSTYFIETDAQNVSIENLKSSTTYNVCVQTEVDYHRGPKSCLPLTTKGSTDVQTILLSTFLGTAIVAIVAIMGIIAYRRYLHDKFMEWRRHNEYIDLDRPEARGGQNPLEGLDIN